MSIQTYVHFDGNANNQRYAVKGRCNFVINIFLAIIQIPDILV
jgi:hypothetical protein